MYHMVVPTHVSTLLELVVRWVDGQLQLLPQPAAFDGVAPSDAGHLQFRIGPVALVVSAPTALEARMQQLWQRLRECIGRKRGASQEDAQEGIVERVIGEGG